MTNGATAGIISAKTRIGGPTRTKPGPGTSGLRRGRRTLRTTDLSNAECTQPRVGGRAAVSKRHAAVLNAEGISERTGQRARDELKHAGLINRTKTGLHGGWIWRLAEDGHELRQTENAAKNELSQANFEDSHGFGVAKIGGQIDFLDEATAIGTAVLDADGVSGAWGEQLPAVAGQPAAVSIDLPKLDASPPATTGRPSATTPPP